jgi:hypothetical protein
MSDSKSWFEQGKEYERERIIAMLTEEYGEDYVDIGVVGQIVKLIEGEN